MILFRHGAWANYRWFFGVSNGIEEVPRGAAIRWIMVMKVAVFWSAMLSWRYIEKPSLASRWQVVELLRR
jgi:peptidoglycan/LPS O-acetylase OafA/YrhL